MNKNSAFSLFLIFSLLGIFIPTQSWAQSEQSVIIPLGSSVRGCEQTTDCFIPSIITIEQGSSVIWLNEDTESHSVTSGTTSFGPDGKFASETINPGESFSVTFEEDVFEPGTYFYYDSNHLWMKGIVLVQEPENIPEEGEIMEESTEEPKSPTEEKKVEETDLSTSQEELESINENQVDPFSNDKPSEEGGGCLIATATYGSELSPQVQKLREIRDNMIMKTEAGSQFMSGFNQFYYSFSPTIADWERQVPIFKDTVKIVITPLLTSLSILSFLDIDSETEVVGFGIGIILLNASIYFFIPFLTFFTIKRKLTFRK